MTASYLLNFIFVAMRIVSQNYIIFAGMAIDFSLSIVVKIDQNNTVNS